MSKSSLGSYVSQRRIELKNLKEGSREIVTDCGEGQRAKGCDAELPHKFDIL